MIYDVLIIGAGPGGYNAANKASKNGLKVALFEKNKIGGTCLNRGCIPMKSLLSSAKLLNESRNGELYGIKYDNISFDYERVNERKNEVVETLRNGVIKELEKNKVDIIYGEAKLINNNKVICNDNEYEGKNIIIASGSIVSKPPIQGIDLCIDSDKVLETNYELPESLIIIGGGVIGVEIASALSSFGVNITIIEMADRLLATLDKDLGQRLQMFFKKNNIEVITSASVKNIKEENDLKIVEFENKKQELETRTSKQVLIATGRKANIDNLISNDFDLEINKGIVGDEIGKTNYDNVFVIGDCKDNNIQLAHVAEAQADNIIDYILNKELSIDMSVIPSGVYTDPEIAVVGLSEEYLKDNNIEYNTYKYLTGANGKCLIENSESGFVKLLTVDNKIVGGQLICPHATELIAEFAIAIEKKMSIKEFKEVIHPHPTISEMLWNITK